MIQLDIKIKKQKNKGGKISLLVECDKLDKNDRWFHFTRNQIESGRWKKHVKMHINELSETYDKENLEGDYQI